MIVFVCGVIVCLSLLRLMLCVMGLMFVNMGVVFVLMIMLLVEIYDVGVVIILLLGLMFVMCRLILSVQVFELNMWIGWLLQYLDSVVLNFWYCGLVVIQFECSILMMFWMVFLLILGWVNGRNGVVVWFMNVFGL